MSSEIESKLEQLFSQLPEPDAHVSERTRARALEALPARELRPQRPVRALALLLAASLVLLAVAAGALAAAGALHVSFGQLTRDRQKTQTASLTPQLTVPHGARGIAAVVDGRLWLTTSSGLRLEGLPVSAAALSPHALYVAVGIGNSLAAIAPDGRRAWSHRTGAKIAAIGWAPDGLRIAYVVHHGSRFRLHVIDGNGNNDRLIDKAARPVRPSWRADSLAFAYVGAGGRPIVYDLGHRSRKVLTSPSTQNASLLAFAPSGKALAIATRHGFLLTGAGGPGNGGDFRPALIAGLGWLDGELAVAVNPALPGNQDLLVQLFQVNRDGEAIPMGQLIPPAPVKAFDAAGDRLTVAVSASNGVRVLASSPNTQVKRVPLPQPQSVLELAPKSRISSLAVR